MTSTPRPKLVVLTDRRVRQDTTLSRAVYEHESALKRFLRARLAHHADREDVIQDVFLRLCQQDAHHTLEARLGPDPDATRAYLLAIAGNLVRDRYRRRVTRRADEHVDVDSESIAASQGSPEDIVQHREELAAIAQALRCLEPRMARAFLLNRVHNQSYREIAAGMNVSVSLIEKYIARVLVALRAAVKRS